MVTLMDAKHAEQVSWRLFRSGTALALPVKRRKVICSTQDRSFAYVKMLGEGIQV